MADLAERKKTLEGLMNSINRKAQKANPQSEQLAFFAAGNEDKLDYGTIPTGNPAVDEALNGGLPKGAIVMIAGTEGAGKTCLAFDTIAHNQKLDEVFVSLYVHLESKSFPLQPAINAGVDLSRLIIINANSNAEKTFDLMMEYLWDWDTKTPRNLVDLVVVDSIAAAVPAMELDASEKDGLEKATVGRQAAMMSKTLRILTGTGSLGRTCMCFINQLRTDINSYGGGTTLPGGKASVYYPKIIISMRAPKGEYLRKGTGDEQVVYGHLVKGEIQKNNTGIGKPHATFQYEVIYGEGVDPIKPLLQAALNRGVITRPSKVAYQLPSGEKVNGRENMENRLKEDVALRNEISELVSQSRNQPVVEVVVDEEEVEEEIVDVGFV